MPYVPDPSRRKRPQKKRPKPVDEETPQAANIRWVLPAVFAGLHVLFFGIALCLGPALQRGIPVWQALIPGLPANLQIVIDPRIQLTHIVNVEAALENHPVETG